MVHCQQSVMYELCLLCVCETQGVGFTTDESFVDQHNLETPCSVLYIYYCHWLGVHGICPVHFPKDAGHLLGILTILLYGFQS